ncbi:MAG: acyl-CoA dehydratase activase-related protein [Bacilli bacterium]
MKKKIKIGIPRAFLYYRNYILWKNFFEIIGCNIVLSPNTDSDIVKVGSKLSVDESCLPSKIYLGHINYLIDKCDYVLITRIYSYGRKKRVCVKFNGIYDVVNNIFPNINILDYNIDNLKFKYELFGFIKMGLKLNRNIFRIIYAYIIGKIKEYKYNKTLILKQDKVMRSNKLKVLIVSHPYIVYDKYLSSNIINYLKDEDIDILYSDRMDRKESIYYAEEESNTLYFLYSKENIGSAFYYKDLVDGIIFLSSFPCGVDSLVNELVIRKIDNVPCINIILDDSTSTGGLYTRLESFVDIIKARHNNG